jgi:non-homologous end joining protein Ku
MSRASWRGYLRLSLVSCPIYLSPATARTKTFRLHQVWRATQADEAREVSDQARGQDVPERPALRFTPDYVEDQPERARHDGGYPYR